MVVLKNILVTTDFSQPSMVALDYGRDLARSYGATLHVLHVVVNSALAYSPELGFATTTLPEDLENEARRQLDALITSDDRNTLRVVAEVESHPSAAAAIIDYAAAKKIDLIVVGTHGRSAITKFLMGSVAEKVVRAAPCPVLTVREHERDFLAPDALIRTGSAQG